jgi:hypothetical protein
MSSQNGGAKKMDVDTKKNTLLKGAIKKNTTATTINIIKNWIMLIFPIILQQSLTISFFHAL